jgi:equilibrative nucleoside transporter 1/2/3
MAPASGSSLAMTLALVALCGAADGVAQGALFGEAARLGPKYTQALVQGTAISGVAVSALRVATKAALPNTRAGLHASASIYFLAAAAVCAACCWIHAAVLPRLGAVKAAKLAMLTPEAVESGAAAVELSAPGDGGGLGGGASSTGKGAQAQEGEGLLGWRDDAEMGGGGSAAGAPRPTYLGVLRQVRTFAAALVAIYAVSLSIFPGVLAEDVSSKRLGSWYVVGLLAAFNAADLVGKWLPAAPALRLHSGGAMAAAAGARLLFVPAFHLAATRGGGPAVVGPLTLLLGVTNGYLTASAMMAAPLRVAPQAAALAGNIMVLALIAGLCIGAACGFLWLL